MIMANVANYQYICKPATPPPKWELLEFGSRFRKIILWVIVAHSREWSSVMMEELEFLLGGGASIFGDSDDDNDDGCNNANEDSDDDSGKNSDEEDTKLQTTDEHPFMVNVGETKNTDIRTYILSEEGSTSNLVNGDKDKRNSFHRPNNILDLVCDQDCSN
ncbi:hypothetical protein Tco_1113313 [Tanacetum coccineum]|uniref:Uncharacterized protein n=1 Tax=Tanacetum coccineum TaxID=301880 RepID=A0ABQ5ITC9_9ASTR